jgi:hypothetical protein
MLKIELVREIPESMVARATRLVARSKRRFSTARALAA